MTIKEAKEKIQNTNVKSAWNKGVKEYAKDLLDSLYYLDDNDEVSEEVLLNGADDWKQYSWGGCSLIYNEDIAKRLCSPSELKKTNNGERRPNKCEEWLDTQARALYQASLMIFR